MGIEERGYRLKVTAGPDYDPKTHQIVQVNADKTLRIENEHSIVSACVRVQDYDGYPDSSLPTSLYFSHPLHQSDQYSISFSVIFKKPANGNDVVFGNDFDYPIRDNLPPGFGYALHLVRWMLDPTMDGDVYSDKPHLYSPALATWNQFRVGEKIQQDDAVPSVHDRVVEEGADGDGDDIRSAQGIPGDVKGRRKHFQYEENRKAFEWEAGRLYWADFGNPYLDFRNFSLRLPGFSLPILDYLDEKHRELRYVLKNRQTGDVYLVVLFALVQLDGEDEPAEKENAEKMSKEVNEKKLQDGDNLGKYGWEPENEAH